MNGCDDWMRRLTDMLGNGVWDELWWRNLRGIMEELMTDEMYQHLSRNEEAGCWMHVWRDNEEWKKWHKTRYESTYWIHVSTWIGHESTHSTHVDTCRHILNQILKFSENWFNESTYTKHESTHEVQQVKNLKHKVLGRPWKTWIETCMKSFWETHANGHFLMIR